MHLGDLSLELVSVFDPRDGRLAEGVFLRLPLLDGLLLRVGQILLRDRKGFLSLLVLLRRVLESGEREHERRQSCRGSGGERGNATEAGNNTAEGRHGGSAEERDSGEHRVENTERLSRLRHRDGGVLDPPVQSAHPRLGEIDVAREVDQAIPVDVDSDVNVLVIERLGGRGDRSDLRQRLTLGDVDADPLVADGLEGGVDGRDVVVDALGVDADLNVFGLLAEGGELGADALVLCAVEIDVDTDIDVAHRLGLGAELLEGELGAIVVHVDLEVHVAEDALGVHLQRLELPLDLIVTSQRDLGVRLPALVVVEVVLEELEVVVGALCVQPDMGL